MALYPLMKVLFTASTYSHIGHFHLPYLRAFQERGWETHIACADAPAQAPFTDQSIPLPLRKSLRAPENFTAARTLRRRIRAERYDLVVTHTSLAAFFTRLAVKGLRDRPRLVNMVHGYLFDDGSPAPRRQLLLAAERLTAPETDLLLTMNQYDYALAKRFRLGRRVLPVPGIGVDFSRLDAASPADGAALRERYGVPPEAFLLVYAAEFSERKSQAVLLRAMERLPERAVLALPGGGALWEDCRALAERLELGNRVLFPGQQRDMAPWYRAADAAVSASRSEGLPFNIMEAMYAGLPVVASAVKGHTDLIAEGETGLLYPYGDAEGCAAAVRELMEDAALRARISSAAAERVRSFGLDRVLPEVMAAYLSAAETEKREVINV